MSNGFQRLGSVLQGDGAGKAAIIMADPLQALRLDLNDAKFPTHESFRAAAEKIKALIPHYYPEADREKTSQAFDRELLRAEQAIATGSSKRLQIDGQYDNAGPNLYTPERLLLWYAALSYMEQVKPPEGEDAPQPPDTATIVDELARSKGADHLLDTFSAQVTPILATLGIDKNDCIIRWGEPGSGFWHRTKDPEHGEPQDIINFDIKKTLLMGDHTQQVMVHELGHYLYDTTYPPALADRMQRITAMQKKKDGGEFSEEEERELRKTLIEQHLFHNVWNAAADNAVDESTHRLSSGAEPVYRSALLPGFLTTFITQRGQGGLIRKHQEDGALTAEQLQERKEDLQVRLNHLQNTLLQVSSLAHGQLKAPDNRGDLVEALPQIGIYPELLNNFSRPGMSGEDCFWDLYGKCEKLAHLTPDPALMKTPRAWREARDRMQAERNQIHEAIFTEYAAPLIEQIVQQQQTMDDLQKKLEELMKNIPPGQGPTPGTQPGSGAPSGQNPPPGMQPGSSAPPVPGPAVGKPKTVGGHEKDAVNGTNSKDPESASPSNMSPAMGALKPGTGVPKMGAPGGKATDAIAAINLGDGRSLEELQNDPLFAMAIDQIKEHLHEMMEQFAVPVSHVATYASDILPTDDPAGRLDIDEDIAYSLGKVTGIPHLFRGDVMSHIPAVGDVILAIDTSGSMGWGRNSHAEHCIKAAALLTLGIMAFNEERRARGLSEMGVYIMLWGNGQPTFLGKPYDGTGQAEIISRLDEVLKRVKEGRSIEGLHGGTELEGTFKTLLEEYAEHRPGSNAFDVAAPRGPVLMLLKSDGGVFDMKNVPLSRIMQAMPSLTVDTALTNGRNSALHNALLQAERAEEYQRPVCVDMNDKSQILPGMMQWMEGRMETFRNNVPWDHHYDVFTENDVNAQAFAALGCFGKSGGFSTKLKEARAAADVQQRDKFNLRGT